MVKPPLVSIILPTYNGKVKWISEAIQSVLAQSYLNWELIIIDDASKNSIENDILKFVKNDKRIVYYKNKENLQLTNTLNKGIRLSKWRYIARLDDDDIRCDSQKLEKQIKFMESNKNIWLCGTCVININEIWDEISYTNVPEHDNEIRKNLMRFNQFAHASVVFRKDVIKEVWNYNPLYNGAEDYEFWLRIWSKYQLANLSDYSLKYRYNTQWISVKKSRKQWLYGIKIAYKYRNYYPWFWKYIIPRCLIVILPRYLVTLIIKWIKK